jgi:CheY-like chemotaxis protein
VDDNPINILLATKLIQQYYPQAKVSSAKSGKEAIELYKNEDFDLILMDVHMPEMNGYETTHALRFLKPNASTKIVALTASDTIEEREECINHKMDGYLTKPIKEKDFLAIVSAK